MLNGVVFLSFVAMKGVVGTEKQSETTPLLEIGERGVAMRNYKQKTAGRYFIF